VGMGCLISIPVEAGFLKLLLAVAFAPEPN